MYLFVLLIFFIEELRGSAIFLDRNRGREKDIALVSEEECVAFTEIERLEVGFQRQRESFFL